MENQEQYSRRTSLRFHNIAVPIDNRGRLIQPVDTDTLVLNVCNNKLGLQLTINDIGRSHVIGKVRNGKSQVIVRFLSYRTRQLVYTNKKRLKEDQGGIFITENLTQFRTSLTKRLADMKFKGQINAYWTSDGRIFVKETENSRKKVISNFDQIEQIDRRSKVHATDSDGSANTTTEFAAGDKS